MSPEESNNEKTARFLKAIADSVMPKSIVMEIDLPEKHADGYLPILDTKMQLETINGCNKIRHVFYQKPMASQEVTWKKSSLGVQLVRDILVNDLIRRLRNCDFDTDEDVKSDIISEFVLI